MMEKYYNISPLGVSERKGWNCMMARLPALIIISCLNVRAYFSCQNIESKSVLQSCQLFSPTDHKTDKICIAACHKCTCIRWPIYIDNLLDCAIQAQERIWSKIFQKCSKNMNISRYLIFLVFPKDKKLKCIQYILLKKLT